MMMVIMIIKQMLLIIKNFEIIDSRLLSELETFGESRMVAHTRNPAIRRLRQRGRGQSGLHSEFHSSLDYRLYKTKRHL